MVNQMLLASLKIIAKIKTMLKLKMLLLIFFKSFTSLIYFKGEQEGRERK